MFDFLVKDHDKLALSYAGRKYSYRELLQYSKLFATYYESLCSERVERIMYFSKNTPEYIFALYGAFRLGATTIPVDVMSTVKDLSYMINDSRPQILYTTPENREVAEQSVAAVTKEDSSYTPTIFTFEDLDCDRVDQITPTSIATRDADEVMTIIYTSGTTGSPKGVMLTYANLWYNVDAVANFAKIFNINTRLLMILPINHIFAFAGALVAPLYAGGTIYIVEQLAPETIISTLKEGRITLLIGVPRLYETFAKGIMAKINANIAARILYKIVSMIGSDKLAKIVFKSAHDTFGGAIEYFVSGGAALPIETGNIFKNLGFYVLEGYGMTECAPMISFTRPGERKVGYCGRMLPGCEYKIEESGELCVRGANVMKGYYKRPEETAAVLREGWLYTGDTALYDDKYGIQITGRIKEIIVTPNGKNINPASIENEITQSSTIIKEAAIVLHENTLQAIIYPDMTAVRADDQSTLDELIRGEIEEYNKASMGYKRIMRYHITSQELPKTRLGKIQRYKLSPLLNKREETPKEDVSNRSDKFKALKAFLDDQTGVYANGDSHFEIDLALDSLGRVSLLAFIEDSFGVSISESQLSELSTLNLLSAYIEEHSESTTLSSGDISWNEILQNSSSEMKLPRSGAIHWFIHVVMWLFFSIFYRFSSKGHKSIPKGPVLFVANHRSGFDGVFVTTPMSWSTVHNSYFFAKDKHFQGGFKRYMASRNNIILMNINSNVRESMQQMYSVLSQGHNIVIFPEGTRSKDGVLGSFKESFAILSQSLNIPVVPVVIRGSEGATFNSIRIPRLWQAIGVEYLDPIVSNDGETSLEFAKRVEDLFAERLLVS